MGTGSGDFVVSSDGRLSCGAIKPACASDVTRDVLRSLEREVRAALPEAWLVLPPNSNCRDCLTTTLVLTSRNSDGTLSVMRAAWDPTTRAKLAGAIVNLHDLTRKAAQPLTK